MPDGQASTGQTLSRMAKWLIFSVSIALIPLIFVSLSGSIRGVDREIGDIIGKGELLLVVIALSGAAIGDLFMSTKAQAFMKLFGGGLTILVLVLAAFLYVDIFNAVSANVQLDTDYIVHISIALFGFGLICNGCCIFSAE